MGGGAQKSTILHSSLGDGGMPISLLFSSHLLNFIVLSHSSSLHPSICPRSVVMTRSGSDRGGGGVVVGKALRWLAIPPASRNSVSLARRIHYAPWRGKHRSFPVGLSLHGPNPKHTLSSLSSADNLPCTLGTGTQASDCKSVPLKQPRAECNM